MKLAEALQDTVRTAQLEDLQYEIDSKIKAMELNKNVLENTLAQELRDIARQREELDRKEKGLIEGMKRDDAENKVLVGVLLSDSVRRIFGGVEKEKEGEVAVVEGEERVNGVVETEGEIMGAKEAPDEEAPAEELMAEEHHSEDELLAKEELSDESLVEKEFLTPEEQVEESMQEETQGRTEEPIEGWWNNLGNFEFKKGS
jgi:hypothetical protein